MNNNKKSKTNKQSNDSLNNQPLESFEKKSKESQYRESLNDLLDNNKDFRLDAENVKSKGDPNKDIRMNPNMNRKEVDVVTSENQLR